MRIYAITPNPALDLSGHVARIVANEKNHVSRARLDPGGNGINAARIARRLGARPQLLGFAGGGAGAQLEGLLRAEGLEHRFTKVRGTTRTNVTVTNDRDRKQTRLTFPGPTIGRSESRALLSVVSRLVPPGIVLLGGSRPPGCPPAFYRELIERALQRRLGAIVDVPADELVAILRGRGSRLLLIKPNQAELEEVIGRRLRSDAAIMTAALELNRRAALVCVSLAERGAILASGGRAWLARAPHVKARGTVGAGDSMVGAMATRLAHWKLTRPELIDSADERMILDALRWGVAAGAATAGAEGTSLGQPGLIGRLRAKVRISIGRKLSLPAPSRPDFR